MAHINLPDQVQGVLSPTFGGVSGVTQSNEVLPASTKARAVQSLEINSAYSFEIPATSSLAIEAFNGLDGITIGAHTPAVSVAANTLSNNLNVALSGTQKPWLNQSGLITGSLPLGGNINGLLFNDQIVGGAPYITTLQVWDVVLSPATGPRRAIQGQMLVTSAGTNTNAQAQYVAVHGLTTTGFSFGGTSTAAIGEIWGGWFQALTTGGTYHASAFGVEIDVSVQSAEIELKVGLRVELEANDTTRGTTDDAAVQVISSHLGSTTWVNGIKFGTDQANEYSPDPTDTSGFWPFASDSTIIGTSSAGNGLPANIGIDFSNVTFTTAAIKLPAAPIAMAGMSATPTAITGYSQFYVKSDGALYYLSPGGTETQIAPA